jgi:hypothetical protein
MDRSTFFAKSTVPASASCATCLRSKLLHRFVNYYTV